MPRGHRTSYVRDNRGRFASSPGGGGPKRSTPATRRAATRAGNRLNRDNSGRITGIGRDGATVRGGRIRTAKGNRRATQLASMRPAGFRSGTIAKPQGLKPGAIAARKAKAAPVKPPQTRKAATASKSASVRPTKATKAERVIARIEGNQARGSTVARSKKEDRRLARTLAISQFAKSYVSERAVGNRDPNAQYKKADLLPQLNKALSRPTPKKQRKSTTRSNDPEKGLIALGVAAALKTRAKYRAEGRLLPARRSPRKPPASKPAPTPRKASPKGAGPRMKAARPAGTVAKPKGLKVGAIAARRAAKMKGAIPPKPTAMKVNLFQQAIREASSRNRRGNIRTNRQNDAAARIVNSRIGGNTPAGSIRKAERSLQTAQAAYAYRNEGFITSSRKGRKGYRAPRTRLY